MRGKQLKRQTGNAINLVYPNSDSEPRKLQEITLLNERIFIFVLKYSCLCIFLLPSGKQYSKHYTAISSVSTSSCNAVSVINKSCRPNGTERYWPAAVECCRRQTTTTDASDHHQSGPPTLCVGGPVIICQRFTLALKSLRTRSTFRQSLIASVSKS